MTYYARINSKNVLVDIQPSMLQTDEYGSNDVQNIEVTQEYWNNWLQYGDGYYIYNNNEVIVNPNYEQEQQQKEQKRINQLNLTKADFWIALLDRDITKNMVKEKIELIPDEKLKAKTIIRLDDADHFWRGDPSMDIIGAMFDITPADLDYLFENKALPIVDEGEVRK